MSNTIYSKTKQLRNSIGKPVQQNHKNVSIKFIFMLISIPWINVDISKCKILKE